MYAIIETGGKQYKVVVGQEIEVEKLDAKVGDKVNLKTLMTSNDGKVENGNPYLADTIAEIVNHGKDRKITVLRYKAKKNVRKKQGHRQPFTTVKIIEIK